VIACGALAGHVRDIAARRGWPVVVRPLPAVLHNRPRQILAEAERAVQSALAEGRAVAVAYADCGTYRALDELCARYQVRRLPGLHCYDLLAGQDQVAAMFAAEPGTYVLTDFLLRGYTRLVWLAQQPTAALEAEADRVAGLFGLPLTRVETGLSRLERALAELLAFDQLQPAQRCRRAAPERTGTGNPLLAG
jgi:hypothetical protein